MCAIYMYKLKIHVGTQMCYIKCKACYKQLRYYNANLKTDKALRSYSIIQQYVLLLGAIQGVRLRLA